nr:MULTISPECIES: immunoglobulin-like domain-containing protein [unclassified Halomonas]
MADQAEFSEAEEQTFTVSLSEAVDREVTVTLDGGNTVTIAAGETDATYTRDPQGDDVFVDGENVTVALEDAAATDGSAFENVTLGDAAETTVTDTIDTVDATLTSTQAAGSNEDAVTVTYTITLGTAPTATETFTFDVNGEQQTITIEAGATSGTTEFTFSDPDVFVDSDTISAPTNFESSNNSGYEDLNLVNSATAHEVVDSIDITTLTLNDVSVEEGTGTATITATLSNPAGQGFTVTLSNGATIVFAEGATEGTSNAFVVQGDDVYLDSESYSVSVADEGDHNFEKLDSSDSAMVTVNDTIDITTVGITAIVTKTSEINVGNVDDTDSFTVTAYRSEDDQGAISKVTGTDHDGFGVEGTTSGSGDSSELGYGTNGGSEKIVVDFNNEVKTFDIQFAWRNNGEKAKVEFFDEDGNSVGWAIVSGGGTSTDALVTYYDAEGKVTKTEHAAGGSDRVDNSYTFEPGSGETFVRAEFTAVGFDDDYLIHSIQYKEVMNGEAISIDGASEVIFEIETSNHPDESKYDFVDTFPTATVNIGGEIYEVKLDRNGKGSVAVETDGAEDLVAKVIEVNGNFEEVAVPVSLTLENNTPTIESITTAAQGGEVDEGDNAVFEVALSNSSGSTQTYAISLGATGDTATSGSDYDDVLANATFSDGVTYANGQIAVPAGITTFSITVETIEDFIDEADETFTLTVGGESAEATIIDADSTPTSTNDVVSLNEGASNVVLGINDFGDYSDVDNEPLESVRIESLPDNEIGKLQLNGIDVAVGEEVTAQQLTNGELAFIPANSDTDADTSFEFKVSDGQNWSADTYMTTVNIDAVADKPTVAISLGDAMSVDETGTISGQSREFTELLGEERGDGNIQGTPNYNYSEASTQVFDFGTVFAGQQVTVDMPVLIQGSWNSGWNVFDDRWVVRANGDEEFVFDDYGSSSNYNLNFVDNVSITTTLDSQGRLTLEFSAATTETSETATIQGATVSVGSVEVTEVSAYQYAVDLTAALSDTDGSETLSIKVTGVPEGGVLSQGAEQGDGSWLIEVDPGETSYSGNGLTLTVPVGQAGEDFQLSAEAIATESNPGTTDTTVETLTRSATDSAESKTVPIPPDNTASEPDDNSGEPEGSWEGFESNDDHTLNWWDPSEPYNLGGNATSVDIELQGFGGVFDSGYVEFYEDGNSLGYSYLSKGSNNGSFEQTFTPGFEFDSVKVVRTGGEFEIKSLAAYNATQAQLVDGIVEGAMYTTSSGLSGTTDENGAFEYRDGDSVTFMVGDVVIGTASAEALADGKVFLQEMANTELTDLNNEYVENMAVFLQSLDADGIADNGITITSAMNAAFEGSTLDLRNVSEAELKSALEGVGDSYVTEEDAMQHVRDMLEKHAGITTFDEHTDDSIKTAVLAHDVIDGLTYQTSSGLIGELTDGMFAFDEGDTVELFANGQLVASFATADIGDDGLITFAEAGFLMSAEELDALINSEEETQPSVEGEEAVDEPEPTDDTTVDDAEDIDEEESRDDNITDDDTSSSDKASEDESEEEVVEEGVATPDDEQSQDDALTQGDELAQEEVLADNDEVTNVAPATPGDEKEEPESSGNGYSLLEDDETLFTLNDDSENATTPVPASELQTSESEGDIEASLSESELFSSDEDESVDSLLPPSESGEEKAKPAPDAPQESTVSTEVEPAGGHTDYVKLHNDHATSNSDI